MAMKLERRTAPIVGLEVRAASEGTAEGQGKTLIGHASVFNTPTELYRSDSVVVREIIRPGAFSRAIREGQDVKALYNHDPNYLLGRTRSGSLRLSEDATGLRYELDWPDTTLGRDLRVLLDRGDINQNSFAFLPVRPGGRKETITQQDGVEFHDVEITDVDLFDISLVTYPAYPEATVDGFRSEEKSHAWLKQIDSQYHDLTGFAQGLLS